MGNLCSYAPTDEGDTFVISLKFDGVLIEAPTSEVIISETYTLIDSIRIRVSSEKLKYFLQFSDLKTEVIETKWLSYRLYKGTLNLSPCFLFLDTENNGYFVYGNQIHILLSKNN